MLKSGRLSRAFSIHLVLSLVIVGGSSKAQTHLGTAKHPIIDSKMSKNEAFDGLDPKCPDEIRKRQGLVTAKYYSMDKQIHQGQWVIDRDLKDDIQKVLAFALKK